MGRQASQAGLQPLLWSELEAFGRLRGIKMSRELVRLFRKLEQILLRFSAEQLKKAIRDDERNNGRPG